MKKYPSVIIATILTMFLIINIFIDIPNYIIFTIFVLGIILFVNKNYQYNILAIALILSGISIFNFNNLINNLDYSIDNHFYNVTGDIKKINNRNSNTAIIITNVNVKNINFQKDIIVYLDKLEKNMKIGDKVAFASKLNVPYNNSNPGNFNYYKYLLSEKIFAYSYVNNLENIGRSKNNILVAQGIFNKYINNVFNKLPKLSKEFLTSIFTGNNTLPNEHRSLYNKLGISHILAISGFHIILIQSFLFFLFKRIYINKNIKQLIIVIAIFIYCILIGFPASAVRAFIFLIVNLIAVISYKSKIPIKTLAIAAIIILVINPIQILNIGFQFSFLATLGIMIFYPIFKDEKLKNNNIKNKIYYIISANLLIFPLQIFYFKSYSLSVFISNIIAIPILILIIYLGIIFIFTNKIKILSFILSLVIDFLYNFEIYILKALDIIFEKFSINIVFNKYEIISIYFFIIIITLIIYCKNKIYKEVVIDFFIKILPIHIIFLIFLNNFNPIATFSMINVGQGDSFILKTSNKTVIFDTGGSIFKDSNSKYLLETLKYLKIKNIDAIFLSHFDEDHCGNLKVILNEYGNIPIYGRSYGNEILKSKYKLDHLKYNTLNSNSEFIFDNVKIHVIKSEDCSLNENNNSIVLKIQINKNSILLTGDIEKESEFSILSDDIKSTILKIPHHGSKTSSTKEFLSMVKPDIGLLSVGLNNIYNLPNNEILDKYMENNIKLYRTDLDGFTILKFYDDDYKIYTNNDKIDFEIFNKKIIYILIYYCIFLISLKIHIGGHINEKIK